MPDTLTPPAYLLAAIDEGDDIALPILADWLEEAGDARAGHVREEGELNPPRQQEGGAVYLRSAVEPSRAGGWLPHSFFPRLAGGVLLAPSPGQPERRLYPTRSAALLALAEALSRVPGGSNMTEADAREMADMLVKAHREDASVRPVVKNGEVTDQWEVCIWNAHALVKSFSSVASYYTWRNTPRANLPC